MAKREHTNGNGIPESTFMQWAVVGIEREIESTEERLDLLKAQADQLRTGRYIGARPAAPKRSPGRPKKQPEPDPIVDAREDARTLIVDAVASPQRRHLSPAQRKAISERMTRRWALFHQQQARPKQRRAARA